MSIRDKLATFGARFSTKTQVRFALLLGIGGVLATLLGLFADFIDIGSPGFGLGQLALCILGLASVYVGRRIHRFAVSQAKTPLRSYGRAVAFPLVALFMMLGFLELIGYIGFRFAGISYHDAREYTTHWHPTLSHSKYQHYESEYPYLPFRVRPNDPANDYSNPKGYRGRDFEWQKPPGTLRVACVGGSTTWEGSKAEAIEQTLQAGLVSRGDSQTKVEALNLGSEGWSSVESLIDFAVRSSYSQPDYVVIYHAINDATASCYPPDGHPEPDYSNCRTRLKEPTNTWIAHLPLWFDQFRVVALTRYLIYRRTTEINFSLAYSKYIVSIDGTHKFQGTDTFRHNIESIVSIALNQGSTVFLVTQVHRPEPDLKEGETDWGMLYSDMMNEVTREIAKRHASTGRVFLIDAATECPKMGIRSDMIDWVHFNKRGYQRLGTYIGEEILRLKHS